MALLLSSHGSIAGCVRPEAEGYAATVDGLPGGAPLAYWRLGETGGSQIIDRKGARHGTYVNAVQFGAAGLPQDSDGAVNFAGTGHATVAHDAGLALSKFSLSLWFRLGVQPDEENQWAILSKEQPGLNAGDFGVYFLDNNEMIVQFQDASTQYRLPSFPLVSANTPCHLCIRVDHTGFDAYLNGEYLGKNTSFTGAWTSNSQPLRIASAPQLTQAANAIVDEVALYDRVLSEAEVIALSQHSQAPVAANDSFVVPENQTAVLNVVNNDIFVGQKANLTVEIVSQATHGMATVRGDNDIEFEANVVDEDEADSFTYRITDQNGTSNTATVNLTVQDTASQGGGTLIYDFQPQASWIDGVPLSSRDMNDAIGTPTSMPSPNRWMLSTGSGGGALVGAGLIRRTFNKANVNKVCWNRAPTGHPSLEMHASTGDHTVVDFIGELFEPLVGQGSRHMRVVMEVYICSSSSPTTFKANGHGPTGGSYPNFSASHLGAKWYCCLYQGERQEGPILCNWWGNSSLPIHRVGQMLQAAGSSKKTGLYIANFDRPGIAGIFERGIADIRDMEGSWHRLEIEIKLTTPSTVPDNARRSPSAVRPTSSGDGVARCYVTQDIDGDLGSPGQRTLDAELTGLIFNPKFDDMPQNFDNMHTLNDCTGFWLNLHYGGQQPAQAASWSWLRRIQVFRHD